jgi:hypothetical protein
MAKRVGMSQTMVSRVWRAFGLQPHRAETFKLSSDPAFIDKVRDVVGLYMSPPDRALVLCVDEKPQIQAVERTAPVLPMRPWAARAPHARLSAARHHGSVRRPDVKTGAVIGACKGRPPRGRVPGLPRSGRGGGAADLDVHLVLDNAATHKTKIIHDWLLKRPRWHLHFTSTSASWLNLVEGWFALLTRRRLQRGVFTSTADLEVAIQAYIDQTNAEPKPFTWIESADDILASIGRFCQRISNSDHSPRPIAPTAGAPVTGSALASGSGNGAPPEVLSGLIERVTFHSPESGFCVLRVKARGHRDLVSVVGHAAMISAGEWVTASGDWTQDSAHGQQFRAGFLKTSEPTSAEGIERYLGSGMIRGIGPVYAKRLVQLFGTEVFDVIEASPQRLREVGGIGPKRMARIISAWADQKVIREIMVFLHERGVGTARAVRIFKSYGTDAVQVMTENPYRLAARHPRHRLPDRGRDRVQARHRENGHDPGAGRDLVCADRGHGPGALRLAGEAAHHPGRELLEVPGELIARPCRRGD